MYGSWTEMFLMPSYLNDISLGHLSRSTPFFHLCKGKSMTYLEMEIICSRFVLFLKFSSYPMIALFFVCLFVCLFVVFFLLTRYLSNVPLNDQGGGS